MAQKAPSTKGPHLHTAQKFAVLATDTALFTVIDGTLMVRLMRIKNAKGLSSSVAMPGGILKWQETAEDCVRRITKELGKVANPALCFMQFKTFSDIERDPRGRVVSVAYVGFVPYSLLSEGEKKSDDEAWWHPARKTPKLAYDHSAILKAALEKISHQATYTTLIGKLVPKQFTLTELEEVYTAVTGKRADKRNFRKKLKTLNLVKPLGKKVSEGLGRPAELFRFASSDVIEIGAL